ncbi:MAG TPA: ABC transporter substrate-binding protein [Anaerolineae bacterium]|nr:ABC transporter substrate-binding protein [Anaerolineae bacterium]HQI83283.1 ABC transporter substrate-binding protein [Anaerolineae bacterium]
MKTQQLRKNWLWAVLCAVVVLSFLASCATPTPQVIEKVVEKTVEVEKKVEVEKTVVVEKTVEKKVEVEKIVEVTAVPTGPGVFNGAYPYQVPPVGHLNMFATNNLGVGIYRTLFHPPLAEYMWADGSWVPYLAESWNIDAAAATLTVYLKKGIKWSNGDDFNAKDVIATFNCRRLVNGTVWRFLESVTAKDDYTVVFKMSDPSTVVERYVIRNEQIVDRATYGEWSDKLQKLVDEGKNKDSDEWKALLQEFNAFRPEKLNATGPYIIDMASINEARMTLVKNPTSYWADKVKFDIVYLYNGETPTVTPLVLAQQVDYATHGFPPATEKAFVASGVRIIRPPIYSGPALYFNHTIYPFNVKEVRQAIAYAVDRNQNGVVSLGQSGKAVKYMAGFSDNMVPLWVDTKLLNTYDFDRAKATKLLEGLGFKKGADGIWMTDKGQKMEYELTAPAEYADWSAAAENLAGQLTEFGIKVTFRGVEFNQHPIDVNQGNFQLAIRGWGAANPHPFSSFVQDFFTHNIDAAEGPGMSFDLNVKTECCGDIDLEPLIEDSTKGLDTEAQKGMVATVAQSFNELLPIVPLWERYGNNPAMDGLHTCGWPADDNPIYKNSPYADSFTVMMIMDGTLYPCNQ